MKNKENKGGLLTNEQVEQDLKVKEQSNSNHAYSGSQDTGDKKVIDLESDVQKIDGRPAESENGEK